MITKTFTYVSFRFNENGFEFQKKFEGELAYFCETQMDVNFEEYLQKLIILKPIIETHKVESLAIFHTLFYDYQCNTEFSPKVMALINELNATFCITTEQVGTISLYQTLDKMRERPAMYMGEATLTALSHFISGFYEGCNFETNESPPFSGFNNFVGNYYGKYTTAGWKNLILADHFGNELEALKRFYELLDAFRLDENRPSSRAILFRLLHVALLDFRAEDEHKRQSQIADLLHHVSNQLHTAVYSSYIFEFDHILQDVFDRARGNVYLHEWIKGNAPKTEYYEYELWHGLDGEALVTTCLKSSHPQKTTILDKNEKLIATFFAINIEKANEAKEAFLSTLP